jgi:hypothetical protein
MQSAVPCYPSFGILARQGAYRLAEIEHLMRSMAFRENQHRHMRTEMTAPGALWITSWRDQLYFLQSSDSREQGPFNSLEEALASEAFQAQTANPELSSRFLSLKRLKEIALPLVAEGGAVWINARGFQKQDGALVRLRERA